MLNLRVKSRKTEDGSWYWHCFYLFQNVEHGFVSSTNAAKREGVFMADPSVDKLKIIIRDNANSGGQNMQNTIDRKSGDAG
jgi:hypothetical protein